MLCSDRRRRRFRSESNREGQASCLVSDYFDQHEERPKDFHLPTESENNCPSPAYLAA